MLDKEPIKYRKIWIIFSVLFILSVPWYFPVGTYKPIIFGVPYWGWLILLVSVGFSITISYTITKLWRSNEAEDGKIKDE